jgi:dihydropteroate synthase
MRTEVSSPTIWKIKGKVFQLGPSPRRMRIIDVTPDSFSDGGRLALSGQHTEPFRVALDAVIQRGLELIRDGADIINIGGESTRPGSEPVSAKEQINRTEQAIRLLAAETDRPISIDTTSAEVADRALTTGAAIVNDLSGTLFDPEISVAVRKHRAGICIGHVQRIPVNMRKNPLYENAVKRGCSFFEPNEGQTDSVGNRTESHRHRSGNRIREDDCP